jgi:anti-sigma B factor antagonist
MARQPEGYQLAPDLAPGPWPMTTTHHLPDPDAPTAGAVSHGFAVDQAVVDGSTVVRVTGEVDAASSPEFAAALDGAAQQGRPVVLDLSRTTFIDSAGIRILVRSMWAIREAGSSLRLASASEQVETVLRITGILDVLKEPAP